METGTANYCGNCREQIYEDTMPRRKGIIILQVYFCFIVPSSYLLINNG
jgi:hypothetical protein